MDVIRRTYPHQHRPSVDASFYDGNDWITVGKNGDFPVSDIPAVRALYEVVPVAYVKLVNDFPEEMTQPEKDAVDAARLEASRDAAVNQLDNLEDILRAFAATVLDEFNTLRALHGLPARTLAQLRTAIRNKLGS